MLSWRAATGCPSTEARISTASPYSASHGARMKTARTGGPSMPGISRSSSNERIWRPNALRSHSVSISPRCSRSSMIIPAHVPSTGAPERTNARSGSASPSRSMPSVIVVDSPPGMTSPSSPSRSAGTRTSRTSAPSVAQHLGMGFEVALKGEDADSHAEAAYQPRLASSWPSSSLRVSSDCIAIPRPSDARATRSGSW